MKKLLFSGFCACFLASPLAFFAQNGNVEVVAKVFGCQPTDSVRLFQAEGLSMVQIGAATKTGADSAYRFSIPKSQPKFYFLGLTDQYGKQFILGQEQTVTIWAGCANIDKARTVGSAINGDLDKMAKSVQANKDESAALLQKARSCPDDACQKSVATDLAKVDKRKKSLLDSLRKSNPILARLAALNTYLNSDATAKTTYKEERVYFAKEFFRHVDFADPAYNDIPDVFEAFKTYANSLVNFGFDDAQVKAEIDAQLAKTQAGSKAHRLALGGVVSGLSSTTKLGLCEQYLNAYGDKFQVRNTPAIGRIRYTIGQARSSMLGVEAPEFTMNDVDGKPLNLKQMRGKVVLVDFWASWCGPCRKENPHVVSAYQKYKDKGFDILGVSLDSNKDRWLDAIKADGLTWPHVSDLKGWQNEAAKLYSVTSIPQSVLLDKQGNIIARNLRGEALEQKLAEIFNDK